MRSIQVFISNKINKDKDNKKPEGGNINIQSYQISQRNEKNKMLLWREILESKKTKRSKKKK